MSGRDAMSPGRAPVVPWDGREPVPHDWPVLVTGAGGFVGGHIARELAGAGHRVRGLSRRPPFIEPGDPPIDWLVGDLRDEGVRRRALAGVRGVIHAASWVCLGLDPAGNSRAINVEATARLLDESAAAGVERFIYTSTLYTLAAGTADEPADEFAAWNLARVESPYTRTKREAERLVLDANGRGLRTIAICPGMVMGPRDLKPTSTMIARSLARHRVVILPPGGIPIVDARTLATAHRRALVAGGDGTRYAVVGPYLSYPELAAVVRSITGLPRHVIALSDRWERALGHAAGWTAPLMRRWIPDLSRQLVAGGFLRLRVDGGRADCSFGLIHLPANDSIAAALTR
jgi:dihydroflavonol-4-reductase